MDPQGPMLSFTSVSITILFSEVVSLALFPKNVRRAFEAYSNPVVRVVPPTAVRLSIMEKTAFNSRFFLRSHGIKVVDFSENLTNPNESSSLSLLINIFTAYLVSYKRLFVWSRADKGHCIDPDVSTTSTALSLLESLGSPSFPHFVNSVR